MPRLRRRRIGRVEDATPRTIFRLLHGEDFDFLDGDYLDDAELAEVWDGLHSELLAQYAEEHPDEKPWAFYEYDAPEIRLPCESAAEAMTRLEGFGSMRGVPGWPGYRVNPAGRVWDIRGGLPIKLHPYRDGHERACVTLTDAKGDRLLFMPVAELIALAFIGKRPAGCVAVQHGDGVTWEKGEQRGHGFTIDSQTEAELLRMLDEGKSADECASLGVPQSTAYAIRIAIHSEAESA